MTDAYDDQGNMTAKNMSGGSYSKKMSYDSFNRLKSRATTLDGYTVNSQYDYDTTTETPTAGFTFGTYRWGRLVRDRVSYPADAAFTGTAAVERFFDYEKGSVPGLVTIF